MYGWTHSDIEQLTIEQMMDYLPTNEDKESKHFPGRKVRKFGGDIAAAMAYARAQ